jgi:hypothetical protein
MIKTTTTINDLLKEIELIKSHATALDKKLKEKNIQTGDLEYALQNLREVRVFLEPTK